MGFGNGSFVAALAGRADITLFLDHLLFFIAALFSHWLDFLKGSAVLVALGMCERFFLKREIRIKTYVFFLLALALFACFQAWQDQYTSAQSERMEIARLNGQISANPRGAPEPTDSLRKRTKALVDDVERFATDRQEHHPPYPRGPELTATEQARIKEQSERYDVETDRLCLSKFGDRTRGVVQELKAKGVDVSSDYFDAMVEQHRCLSADRFKEFRNLAFHVDAADKLVVF